MEVLDPQVLDPRLAKKVGRLYFLDYYDLWFWVGNGNPYTRTKEKFIFLCKSKEEHARTLEPKTPVIYLGDEKISKIPTTNGTIATGLVLVPDVGICRTCLTYLVAANNDV